jgi:hypothetical protein
MLFGSAGQGEFGTYFIGYAATPAVTEQMLVNMFIGCPPGSYDRILDFSTPGHRRPVLRAVRGLPGRPARPARGGCRHWPRG